MPRYFFNLCSEGCEETDVVGEYCPDDVAALGRALRTASEVVQKQLMADALSGEGWIEVEDEGHRPILRLPLRAAAY
ncbi:MAG TPA: hypothetical protein VF727_07435 [Allosphingosinicella sp.]|jgi:hypothetical protein